MACYFLQCFWACSSKNLHIRKGSIKYWLWAQDFYLNNRSRVFLSRNYRPIVAPQKFDVLKTNIYPRSKASRANMLVLRTSIVYFLQSPLFTEKVSWTSTIHPGIFCRQALWADSVSPWGLDEHYRITRSI